MALPKIDIITTQVTIPSTKQKIMVRPFLVKEQKILLTALASDTEEDMSTATKQIVNNCIVTPGIDVDKLELFDLEYLIVQLRIISVGELTKVRFLPRAGTECGECQKPRDIEISLKNSQVVFPENVDKKIPITDSIGLIMRYPNAKMLGTLEKAKNDDSIDNVFKIIWSCVECVYDSEKIISPKDVSEKEGIEFLENLNSQQFAKVEQFLAQMPKLQQTIKIKCKECGFEQDFVLKGLENFFA